MSRSTFAGLNTMVSGININQLSLDTTGHNITNADTAGYSRQSVDAVATRSQTIYGYYGMQQVGTGVNSTAIVRARDTFADRQYWKENSNLQYNNQLQYNYDKIEAVLNDSSSTGIQNSMNSFWSAWKTLSSDAGESSNRVNVRDSGKSMTELISSSTKELQDLITDDNTAVEQTVKSINQTLSSIATLNQQIGMLEANGTSANDLRDQRDRLVDNLSGYMGIDVTEQSNGNYTITSSGNTLVQGNTNMTLECQYSSNADYGINDLKLVIAETGREYTATNGDLKGYADAVSEVKGYIDKMSQMSAYLLTQFNEQHNSAYGLSDCATGIVQADGAAVYNDDGTLKLNYSNNFFGEDNYKYEYDDATKQVTKTRYDSNGEVVMKDDGAGNLVPDSETLSVIEAISELEVNTKFDGTGGTNMIAAKTKSESELTGTTDGSSTASGDNATLLGELLHTSTTASDGSNNMLGGVSLSNFYINTVTKMGVDSKNVDNNVTNLEDILTQVENWRSSTAGVQWDEELTNMIKFQTGYKACSRCLTAMDEMLDKLINSTGTVGR